MSENKENKNEMEWKRFQDIPRGDETLIRERDEKGGDRPRPREGVPGCDMSLPTNREIIRGKNHDR